MPGLHNEYAMDVTGVESTPWLLSSQSISGVGSYLYRFSGCRCQQWWRMSCKKKSIEISIVHVPFFEIIIWEFDEQNYHESHQAAKLPTKVDQYGLSPSLSNMFIVDFFFQEKCLSTLNKICLDWSNILNPIFKSLKLL